MNHIKIVGLLAVAAGALMMYAPSTEATTVTNKETLPAKTIEATNESPLTLTSSGLEVTCKHSAVAGSIPSQGTGKTATGSITTLTFGECTQHVTVKAKGTLEAHWTSGSDGTLTGSNSTVEVDYTTIFGTVHCNYLTSGTDLGTITGATNHSTAKATLDIKERNIPVESTGSNALCGSTAKWEGSYSVNNPVGMTIDAD